MASLPWCGHPGGLFQGCATESAVVLRSPAQSSLPLPLLPGRAEAGWGRERNASLTLAAPCPSSPSQWSLPLIKWPFHLCMDPEVLLWVSWLPLPDPWPQWHWGVLWSLPDSQHRSGDCYGNFETGRKGGGAPRTFLSASLKPLSCLCKFTHPSWAVFKCCLSVWCGCGCWWGNWALMPAQCLLVTQGHFGDLSRKSGGFKATPCCYHQKPNND